MHEARSVPQVVTGLIRDGICGVQAALLQIERPPESGVAALFTYEVGTRALELLEVEGTTKLGEPSHPIDVSMCEEACCNCAVVQCEIR